MGTYRVCAQIDIDAFRYNIDQIRGNLVPGTMLMGVVKANAYGHGAIYLAQELERLGVDWLAVACVDEAIELRRHGILRPVLVLGHTAREQYKDLFRYQITPTVFSTAMAEQMDRHASDQGQKLRIHIKVDTGMSRIGFPVKEESADAIAAIADLTNIEVEGMFTHFACADMIDKSTTFHQWEEFHNMQTMLLARGIKIPICHCSNSAGIIEMPQMNMNMVRAGIIIYGLYPSKEVAADVVKLKPVMSLKSHVTYIKELGAGVGIGYGHTFTTSRKSTVATIPVGYGDGYPRSLSNRGRVLIQGQSAPIIGRICMDQFVVDITELKGICLDDEVTLIGSDGAEHISVEEVAELAGSFNYEFVCNVGRRIPRVYLSDGKIMNVVHYLYT